MSDTTLSKEEKQYKRLTEEPVAQLVLELGLPTTISMLITNLYNMVDTWFVSQLGTSATGALTHPLTALKMYSLQIHSLTELDP